MFGECHDADEDLKHSLQARWLRFMQPFRKYPTPLFMAAKTVSSRPDASYGGAWVRLKSIVPWVRIYTIFLTTVGCGLSTPGILEFMSESAITTHDPCSLPQILPAPTIAASMPWQCCFL